jgi:hypothetical protein
LLERDVQEQLILYNQLTWFCFYGIVQPLAVAYAWYCSDGRHSPAGERFQQISPTQEVL